MKSFLGFQLKGKQSENNPIIEDLDTSCDEEISGLSQLYCPEPESAANVRDVADVLLEMKKMTDKQHASLRKKQKSNPSSDVSALLLKIE
ncbi:MAG: hypothetical protein FVQ84_22230, partial [Planctomycetes bacterium]|nr:hypothetical protein [Planctomycetota bacterium]